MLSLLTSVRLVYNAQCYSIQVYIDLNIVMYLKYVYRKLYIISYNAMFKYNIEPECVCLLYVLTYNVEGELVLFNLI